MSYSVIDGPVCLLLQLITDANILEIQSWQICQTVQLLDSLLWCSTVSYPSDSLFSCIISSLVTCATLSWPDHQLMSPPLYIISPSLNVVYIHDCANYIFSSLSALSYWHYIKAAVADLWPIRCQLSARLPVHEMKLKDFQGLPTLIFNH